MSCTASVRTVRYGRTAVQRCTRREGEKVGVERTTRTEYALISNTFTTLVPRYLYYNSNSYNCTVQSCTAVQYRYSYTVLYCVQRFWVYHYYNKYSSNVLFIYFIDERGQRAILFLF